MAGFSASAGEFDGITIVTEEFPPYNYTDDKGVVTGMATDVVKAAMQELNVSIPIQVKPWKTTYKLGVDGPKTMIFSIGRTPEREDSFKWAATVAPVNYCFFALKTRGDIRINSLDDAKRYRLGTMSGDLREQYLVKNGFIINKQIIPAKRHEQNFERLLMGHIDLWVMPEFVGIFMAKEHDVDPHQRLKKVYSLSELSPEGVYMAFSKDTPDSIVDAFKKAVEKVKAKGEYDSILAKYSAGLSSPQDKDASSTAAPAQ